MAGTVIKRVGILGSGIMGAGIAEVAAKAGYEVVVRSRTAGHRRRHGGRARQEPRPSRSSGASSTTAPAARSCGRVVATDHLRALVDCDLVIESVVEDLAVKKELFAELEQVVQARRDPRHQHLDAAGGRAGGGDRAARPGVRHPLLQPGADDDAGRDRPPAHRQRRDHRRRAMAFAAALRQGRRRGQGPRPASSSTPCCSPTSTTRCGCWRTAPRRRDDIDTAMKGGCNFPMGPFALLDLVGLDTSLVDPRRAVRRVPRPELRRRARRCAAWSPPASSAASPGRASTTTTERGRTAHTERHGHRRDRRVAAPPDRAAADAVGASPTPAPPTSDGLVGVGADLEPGTLLAAYRRGLFPMPSDRRHARLVVARSRAG